MGEEERCLTHLEHATPAENVRASVVAVALVNTASVAISTASTRLRRQNGVSPCPLPWLGWARPTSLSFKHLSRRHQELAILINRTPRQGPTRLVATQLLLISLWPLLLSLWQTSMVKSTCLRRSCDRTMRIMPLLGPWHPCQAQIRRCRTRKSGPGRLLAVRDRREETI